MKTETIFPEACEYLEQVQVAEWRVERLEQRIENLRSILRIGIDGAAALADPVYVPFQESIFCQHGC